MQDHRPSNHSHSGYGVYLVTWMALLVFTSLTVTVAGMHLGGISVFMAILIAAIKGSIVMAFFMHLREEDPLFTILVIVALCVFAIFIGITFIDVPFR